MKCLREKCEKKLNVSSHKSAKYCSAYCYYEAKKDRSLRRYNLLKANHEEEKKNENILAYLYTWSNNKKPLTIQDLEIYGFNFGFSITETQFNGKISKVIGKYAYYIDPKSKNLHICRLSTPQ